MNDSLKAMKKEETIELVEQYKKTKGMIITKVEIPNARGIRHGIEIKHLESRRTIQVFCANDFHSIMTMFRELYEL